MSEIDQNQLNKYLAQAQQDMRSPTQEPYYGQIDPNLVAIILQHSTAEAPVLTENGEYLVDKRGNLIKDVIITKPDIYSYLIELSHLARTSNLDKDKARMLWFMFKKRLRRSRASYRTNKVILDLLGKIEDALFVVVFGDAEQGKRARYLATNVRGIHVVQQKDQDKPWWSR